MTYTVHYHHRRQSSLHLSMKGFNLYHQKDFDKFSDEQKGKSLSFCAQISVFSFVNITLFSFLALSAIKNQKSWLADIKKTSSQIKVITS
jgi:hypothetical protein